MVTPYATLTEANAYNTGDLVWDAASDADKNTALSYGRRYIDLNYSCVTIDMTAIPDDLKEANSVLALAHLTTPVYSQKPEKTSVKSKSVSSSGVSSSKTYAGMQSTLTDPFPGVTMLLSSYCGLKIGTLATAQVRRN